MTVAWLATAGLWRINTGGEQLLAPPATLSSSLPPLPPRVHVALLHGPEHFLRWGCHPMSSCDGVSPIFFRAGAVPPEGVTFSPRQGSSQPQNSGHQPDNWSDLCRELRHEEVSFCLLSRRGAAASSTPLTPSVVASLSWPYRGHHIPALTVSSGGRAANLQEGRGMFGAHNLSYNIPFQETETIDLST